MLTTARAAYNRITLPGEVQVMEIEVKKSGLKPALAHVLAGAMIAGLLALSYRMGRRS